MLIVLAIFFGALIIFLIGIPLYFILWIVGVVDAYRGAERHNQTLMPMTYPGASSPPSPGQPSGQMVCPECGRRYPATQGRFCAVDGAELRPG